MSQRATPCIPACFFSDYDYPRNGDKIQPQGDVLANQGLAEFKP